MEEANATYTKKIADAMELAGSIKAVGHKHASERLALSLDQLHNRIVTYKQDPDTAEIMKDLPTVNEAMHLGKKEHLRKELVRKVAQKFKTEPKDVTDQQVVQYKQEEAQLFIDRASLLGKRHAGTKYGASESTMHTWAIRFKKDPDTAEIMKNYPTTQELKIAGQEASIRLRSYPNWLNNIE